MGIVEIRVKLSVSFRASRVLFGGQRSRAVGGGGVLGIVTQINQFFGVMYSAERLTSSVVCSVRLSVAQYQQPNCSSDFHEIRHSKYPQSNRRM
jgi:hypothetical protein